MNGLYRKVRSVSFNPEEEDAIATLMSFGGYTQFSEFAKAKILGEVNENEKRFRSLENEVLNLRQAYERHHNRWVETAKVLAGTDIEPLVASIYALLYRMAKPEDQRAMDQDIDFGLVKMMVSDQTNGYRREPTSENKKGSRNTASRPHGAGSDKLPESDLSQTETLSPYEMGKKKAPDTWLVFGRQPKEDEK
jgi:hypothetical protein